MKIFVLGNPDLEIDALPIHLIQRLKEAFPTFSFEIQDPNENWDIPLNSIILDTVLGSGAGERVSHGIELAATYPSFRDAEERVHSLIRTAL